MANKYLGREDAPISAELWAKLDAAVIEAAKNQLTGRRLLHIEGPFGLGLKFVPLGDVPVLPEWIASADEDHEESTEEEEEVLEDEVEIVASPALPLALLRHGFVLGTRDLATFESNGVTLDMTGVAESGIAVARAEDKLIFYGSTDLGSPGLLSTEGTHNVKLEAWTQVGQAANDLIKAVTALDAAGFHGPYSLALAPSRYNLLYRLYPQGSTTELTHVQSIVSAGVFKAPALQDGGVLLASGTQFASIVIGQDMQVGFIGPSDGDLEFSVSESLALHIKEPRSICVLEA